MDRPTIIAMLQAHESELRALGLHGLALFGSFARDAADEGSDIDLLGSLVPERRLSLLDVIHIENRLTDLLGRQVDLVDEGSLDRRILPSVRKSLVDAF